MTICEHKMAWSHIRIECTKPAHPDDPEHSGVMLATQVIWLDGDRRDYTGEFVACTTLGCILPGGHHGSHAF